MVQGTYRILDVTLMCGMSTPLRLQDFDGGEVGQFVSRAVVASSGAPTTLTWSAVSTDLFPNGAPDLQSAVIQEEAWAIIAGASRHLRFIFDNEVYAPAISQPKCDGNVESCCRRCRWHLYCQPRRQRVCCGGPERECTVRCLIGAVRFEFIYLRS